MIGTKLKYLLNKKDFFTWLSEKDNDFNLASTNQCPLELYLSEKSSKYKPAVGPASYWLISKEEISWNPRKCKDYYEGPLPLWARKVVEVFDRRFTRIYSESYTVKNFKKDLREEGVRK